MAIRTMIVDDEPLAIERLQLLCAREPRIELIGMASDGEAALRLVDALEPQLMLLDIGMPGMDGISVVRALSQKGRRPSVIFITAFEGFAVEAFDLAAVDYLLKPVAPDRLTRAIDRVAEAMARLPGPVAMPPPEDETQWAREFWVPHKSELLRLDADSIDRVEAERDYMRLHVGQRSYLLHQTISTLEQRLDPASFIRLHRSHIVRREHIERLRHDGTGVWFACLRDGSEVRIGRTYMAAAKAVAGR